VKRISVTDYAARIVFAAAVFVLFQSTAAIAGLCLVINREAGTSKTMEITIGDELSLSFKHSIYGSAVEEIFTLREEGFELTQLRYGEARLVDFYGYEQADFQNGVWVVKPSPALLPSLNLSVSDSSGMNLILRSSAGLRGFQLPPGRALRLSVAICN
jgi:hypothetical protein